MMMLLYISNGTDFGILKTSAETLNLLPRVITPFDSMVTKFIKISSTKSSTPPSLPVTLGLNLPSYAFLYIILF